jgi:large-conductance mechanosensitive channel
MYKALVDFILREKILTFTVLTGMITFQLVSAFKAHLFDPILELILPDENFSYLRFEIIPAANNQKQVAMDFGLLLKEIIKWFIIMVIVFLLYNSVNTFKFIDQNSTKKLVFNTDPGL